MGEVLGLDTVVAVNLGSVEQGAKTEAVQCDREDVPELRYWRENCNLETNLTHP